MSYGTVKKTAPVAPSITERIVTAIYEAIEDGVYVPGQRLIEIDLTNELQVSRPSLREAFQRLTAEGVLEIVPNRGAVVRRLDAVDIVNIQQIRNVLEPLAAYGAAQCINKGTNRIQFTKAAQPWLSGRLIDDVDLFAKENRRLHRTIVEISGNDQLVPIMERLNVSLFAAHFRSGLTKEVRVATAAQHRAFAKAILAGNANLARTLMKQHMAHSASLVLPKQPRSKLRSVKSSP